jgi:glycine/D-amino acid oxidase-like deaminating enzyme/nitrite reductase/ring-hydroxylating ferredoxin subunit
MAQNVISERPSLQENRRCDTVIMGSGISGLSIAYELAALGQKVVVLDRGHLAGGMTSRTTAHLAPICDDGLSALIKMRGQDEARLFQESQSAAVDRIEAIIHQDNISCNFRRLDAYLFPARDLDMDAGRDQVNKEYEAARTLGVDVEKAKGLPFEHLQKCDVLRYPNQATFHPLKYIRALNERVEAANGEIYANSPVIEIAEAADGVTVKTDRAQVSAEHAVFATNSPINDRVALHSKMAPYRTYAMAFTVPKGTVADALYWDTADPYHYVRLQPGPGTIDYLIVGGADHKSGEADDGAARFEAIKAWMRSLLPQLGKEVHRWSGQVMDTIDYCGFIGLNPGSKRSFVATGDSGQGMTHGALAGILIKNLIVSEKSVWQELYDPARKPASAIGNYISENTTAIQNFARYLMPGEVDAPQQLAPGQGGIIRSGLEKLAVCRDLDGTLHSRSATCTHLGCIVHWNSTEQCWDCPCHGSQFAPNGDVMNGPALTPLAPVHVRQKETT